MESKTEVKVEPKRGSSSTQRKPAQASSLIDTSHKAQKAPVVKKPMVKSRDSSSLPRVDIKVPDLTEKMEVDEQASQMLVQKQPLPIKSGVSVVTSRFELEQEIERQFGIEVKRESSLELNIEKSGSQQQPVKKPQDERYNELKQKFENASKGHQFKFTPTHAQVVQKTSRVSKAAKEQQPKVDETNLISFDQIVKQEGGNDLASVKQEDQRVTGGGIDELANLPQQDRVMRNTMPSDQNIKTEKKKLQPQFALSGSAFAGAAANPAAAPVGHQAHKEEKKKKDKILMNEQNWQLAQSNPDLYIPAKLPFFKTSSDTAEDEDQAKE